MSQSSIEKFISEIVCHTKFLIDEGKSDVYNFWQKCINTGSYYMQAYTTRSTPFILQAAFIHAHTTRST